MRNNKFIESEFYCTQCGTKGIPVLRTRGKEREAGHLKKLFCLTCGKEQNHVECKPWTKYTHEDFLFEFEHHNFSEDGLRKMTYGQLKEKVRNEEKLISDGGSAGIR